MGYNNVVLSLGALSALAALGAASGTYFQLRHSRFAHGVDLIFELERRFESPEMMHVRNLAAKALQSDTHTQEIEPVLDFFETLGMLVRQRAVDKELAWNSFSYWVLRYAVLARAQIEARRRAESDDTYWQEFEFLVKCLTQVEIKRRQLKFPPSFSKEQLTNFLAEEATDSPPNF